jgi:hypothetical protein
VRLYHRHQQSQHHCHQLCPYHTIPYHTMCIRFKHRINTILPTYTLSRLCPSSMLLVIAFAASNRCATVPFVFCRCCCCCNCSCCCNTLEHSGFYHNACLFTEHLFSGLLMCCNSCSSSLAFLTQSRHQRYTQPHSLRSSCARYTDSAVNGSAHLAAQPKVERLHR